MIIPFVSMRCRCERISRDMTGVEFFYTLGYPSLEFNVKVIIRDNSISKPFGMLAWAASSKKPLISSSKG
jgi:hypothetical protein